MATKKQNVVLQLDLDLPKGKIKEFSEMLNNSTKIKLDSGKGKDMFATMNTSVKEATAEASKLLKLFNKPVKSADAAKQLGNSFSNVFTNLNKKLLSFQGSVARVFGSKENQEAIALYKELGKTIDDLNKKYKKASELASKNNAIGNKNTITKEVNAAKKEQKEMSKKQSNWTKEEVARYEELNKVIEEGNEKLREKDKLSRRIANLHTKAGVKGQGELSDLTQELTRQRAEVGSGMMSEDDMNTINDSLNAYRNSLHLVENDLVDLGDRSESSWNLVKTSQDEAAQKMKTFKEILQGFGLGTGVQALANGFKRLATYSFDFYKQLDKALTNISIVTRKTRAEVQAFTKDFITMAKQTGMSIDDVAQGAVLFFQQGLSDEEALKMTKIAAEFAKVADITVESASDKLTAAVNGYNMAVSEAADVADKLNVLAAESAASIDELATAMEKGASMASQSGLSFDKYNAILATMIEVTREAPENIGTSMKTIMARFQQIKEAGTTEDGDSDVNAVETALKSVGVSLRDEQGILRDLGDVLDDLGPKWQSLDRNTQAYLGTVIAGTRQQSRFISLMQNWDRALELTTASEQSAGAQALQHQLAMEGLEAAINNLTIAWQNLLQKLTNSDLFKGIIKTLTSLVNLFGNNNVRAIAFVTAMTIGFVKLNKYLDITRQKLEKNANASGAWMVKLNQIFTSTGSLRQAVVALGQAWQVSDTTATNFFTKSIIRAKQLSTLVGGALLKGIKKVGAGIKTLFSNAVTGLKKMKQNNPMAFIGLISTVATAIGGMIDNAIFDGDRKLEKASKALEETLNKMEMATGTLSAISSNLDTYVQLSSAIALSVEQQEKLNHATEALAEHVKDAVIGYDEMGKAILDINKIEEAKTQAKKDKEDAAKSAFGNVGLTIAADLEARGEEAHKNSGMGWLTTGVGAGGGAAAGAIIGTALGGPLIGTAIGAIVGGIAGIINSYAGAKAQEDKLAVKEFSKLLREKQEELLTAMDTITDMYITQGEDIRDSYGRLLASKDDKQNITARMQSEFLNSKTAEISDRIINEKGFDADDAAKELEKLGDTWTETLLSLGDSGVETITIKTMELQKLVDKENKSWNEIKDDFANVLKELNIPEDSKDAIEEAFKASVYSGTSSGVYQAMKDLEAQQEEATSREAYDAAMKKQNWKQSYESWKSTKEAEYTSYWDMINNMGANELSAYGNMGITSNKDVLELYNSKYADSLKGALPLNDSSTTSLAGLSGLYDMREEITNTLRSIGDETSEEYKKWEAMATATENAITTTWKSLPLSVEPTWEQLFEQYEEFTKRASTVWSTLSEIGEDGTIDYDGFKDLATLFDDIDTQLFDPAQLEQYAGALTTIANNLVLVDGELQLNEQALEAVGTLEEGLADAQINGVKNKLLAKKAEMQAQKSMVEADKAYMEAQLAVAESVIDGSYNQEDATKSLNDTKKKFTANAAKLLATYTDNEINAATTYATAWSTAFDKVAEQYNKLLTAKIEGKKANINIVEELQVLGAQLTPTTEGMYDFAEGGVEEASKAIKELRANIAAAEHTIKAYDVAIANIDLKMATLNSGIKSSKEGFQDAGKELDEYISKLEKFLDLLRHIEREEMNLKIAGQLKEMQTGTKVLDRMANQLQYVGHLIQDTSQMYKNYEAEASTSAADIRSGFGDMVTFDSWGNYNVDMNAYKQLSDEKKELLDESLEAYEKLIKERDSYYEKYLEYVKKQIDINQEYVTKYIAAEDTLVKAIKEREQEILDNKLEAIDKEIEAIERAAEARRKAREEEEDAKELSSMQVDLQRALMDSSGASASQILNIQKQIKEKQQEMADNSFDTMVEDMQTQLEEEKELEQNMFNERLEEMDWYWDEVDRIMAEGTDSILETMKLYTDEFTQASELQQTELLKGWTNTFEQAVAIGSSGAKKYQSIVSSLQGEANKLVIDEDVLTDEAINTQYTGRPKTDEDTPKTSGSGNGQSGQSYHSVPQQQEQPKATTWKDSTYGNQITTGLEKTGAYIAAYNVNGKLNKQNIWKDPSDGKYYYWRGALGKYIQLSDSDIGGLNPKYFDKGYTLFKHAWVSGSWDSIKDRYKQYAYKNGGMVYGTGPAWLDGTSAHPEAVLNAMQTKAFLSFTDDLAALRAEGSATTNSSITIDNISFNVESMSSVADGEKAFNAFVDKFKEIGAKQGISVLGTANRN